MDQRVFDAYVEMESEHFWRRGKRNLVMGWLKNQSDFSNGRVLDVGGAASLVTQQLCIFGDVTVVEPDATMVELVKKNRGIKVIQGRFPGLPVFGKFDIITLLDVLEHLEDDRGALLELHSYLKPNGKLVITVPAYMWLWSEHDEILHHKRRYTRAALVKLLESAGYRVVRASYYTALLLPLMALQRVSSEISSKLNSNRELNYRPRTPIKPLNAALSSIMFIERQILRIASLPFGGGIIVHCEPL
jgi:2-polyprenyl-3-methyl-5-hydroxy-6-metoxy-1,4-benzoquinol methylase